MPYIRSRDGTAIYYESHGEGPPIIMLHELVGSVRSFDSQVEALKDRYRCLPFNARGYPPSDVPYDGGSYSQELALDDIDAVHEICGRTQAHILGVSMGAYAALRYTVARRQNVRSLIVVSIGTGSDLSAEYLRANVDAMVAEIENRGLEAFLATVFSAPSRAGWRLRDSVRLAQFSADAGTLSGPGVANTLRGIQRERPPIYVLEESLRALAVPTLVVVGEEDAGCLQTSRFLAATISNSRLATIPMAGHAVNCEQSDLFNDICIKFLNENSGTNSI